MANSMTMYYSVKMMMGLNDYFARFTVMEKWICSFVTGHLINNWQEWTFLEKLRDYRNQTLIGFIYLKHNKPKVGCIFHIYFYVQSLIHASLVSSIFLICWLPFYIHCYLSLFFKKKKCCSIFFFSSNKYQNVDYIKDAQLIVLESKQNCHSKKKMLTKAKHQRTE